MWPASRVVPKELFPLGKVPALVHLIWEFIEAGVRRIVIVVAKETGGLVKGLLDPAVSAPPKVANDPMVQRFLDIFTQVEFVFIPQTGNYGNGTPLIQAADIVGAEPCLYAFGDDIVFGENISRALIDMFHRTGSPVLAAQPVEPSRKSSFGILECHEQDGIQYVSRMIEKPAPDETPSNLAAFGRYLVTPELMVLLRKTTRGKDNEIWFVDSVIQRIKDGKSVCAVTLTTGKWYTVGDPASYADAVRACATSAPQR
jgi:UTP--glucose-1-phosphate uridylyltransferase